MVEPQTEKEGTTATTLAIIFVFLCVGVTVHLEKEGAGAKNEPQIKIGEMKYDMRHGSLAVQTLFQVCFLENQ